MARPPSAHPKLCHHKPTGQAYVRFRGEKDLYCGKWRTREADDKYAVEVVKWIQRGRQPLLEANCGRQPGAIGDTGPTVTEVIAAYWDFAQGYYIKNGKPTDDVGSIRVALRIWRRHYTTDAYCTAVWRACDDAFPPPAEFARRKVPATGRKRKATRWETAAEWRSRLGAEKWAELRKWRKARRWHPHRLRHNAGTIFRAKFGAETARLALGVSSMDVMQIYAERDAAVENVFAQVGCG